MANRAFDLEVAIAILAGEADQQLAALENRAKRAGASIEQAAKKARNILEGEADKAGGATAKAAKEAGDAVEKEAKSAGTTLGNIFDGVAKKIGSVAASFAKTGITTAIGSITAALAGSGAAFAAFDAQIHNLNTITKLSEADLAVYAEQIRTMGRDLGVTVGPAEAAAAAYDIASAGFTDAADNVAVMTAALKGASAGNVDAATSAKLISGSLRAFGADASDAGKYLDVYFKTVERGITTFPELANSLGNVTSIAATAGVSVEELGATIATATNRGINTSTAIDGIRGAITNLLAPSDQAQKEFDKFGITVNEQTLKQKGLVQTLLDIQQATGGSAESFKTILGDVQAFNVAISLTKDNGELVNQNLEMMGQAAGSADASLKERAKSVKFQMDQLKVALETAGVAIGGTFAKPVTDAINYLTDLVTWVDKVVHSFGDAKGNNIGSGFLSALQNEFPAATQMATELWDTVQELFGLFTNPDPGMKQFFDFFVASFFKLSDILVNATGLFIEFSASVVNTANRLVIGVSAAWDGMGAAWHQVTQGMTDAWQYFGDFIDEMLQGIVENFLSVIQSLPGQLREPLAEVEEMLLRTRSELAKRQSSRFQTTLGGAASKITSAPSLIGDSIDARLSQYDNEKSKGLFDGLPELPTFGKKKDAFVGPPVPKNLNPAPGGDNQQQAPPPPPPGVTAEDIKGRITELERALKLEKLTEQQAVSKYQTILAEARKAKLGDEELFKIEKSLHDLQGDIAKAATKAAEERKKANDKLHIEFLKATKGEKDALLEALKQEKEARAAAGANSVELEAWYAAQRSKIIADANKKDKEAMDKKAEAAFKVAQENAKTEAAILEAQDKTTEAAIKKAEAERDASIQSGVDKVSAEKLFQAKRQQVIEQAAKDRMKVEESLQQETLKNEAAVAGDKTKATEAMLKAENIAKLAAYRETIQNAKKAGVDQLVIDRFIQSEQKKILQQGKADREALNQQQTSPVQSLQEAFSTGLGFNFSIGNATAVEGADPAASKAAKALASDLGQLAGGVDSPEVEAAKAEIQTELTIKIVDSNNKELQTTTVTPKSSASERSTAFDYTPGRF